MSAPETRRVLTKTQKVVLTAAFVPMVATGVAGGIGTYSNISHAYGQGTAVGAVAAGEGATAVLALVLLGLTMLGQSSPAVIRAGLWALPMAASAMSAMAATTPGEMVIYALTPMGMTASAEGAAFLARRIVVHRDGCDAEAERKAAAVVQALAYHRARAANHPDKGVRKRSDRKSWRLARKVGVGDVALGSRLLDVQRDRVTEGADAALSAMFSGIANAEESTGIDRNRSTPDLAESTPAPILANPTALPRPVAVGFLKSSLPSKPVPAIESTLVRSIERRTVAAESTRPRRATGRVPDAAKSTRPKRTPAELLDEARRVTADWPDAKLTAEGIRREVRTSPANARALRDTLRGERAAAAA
ncbi:conjugal transfer protein [Streptomyces sp. PSKA54]|uniref:Conjugal transfer protein n=1 Tax=Streptomyces himalayensis subsp. aureolus TaxID=2758039 RepID=A0A7W2HHS3_9ACTN|nr:conjugal transfer protein [Streptomyces himalayensis]MBA4864343.1 conjugal transfer protein [Streptomyces himalayensis subsp. aureolus]